MCKDHFIFSNTLERKNRHELSYDFRNQKYQEEFNKIIISRNLAEELGHHQEPKITCADNECSYEIRHLSYKTIKTKSMVMLLANVKILVSSIDNGVLAQQTILIYLLTFNLSNLFVRSVTYMLKLVH